MPRTSFSKPSLISLVYSSTFGKRTSYAFFSSSETRSNKDICPASEFFFSWFRLSISVLYTKSICCLLPSNPSQAPALIRFSTARLLTSRPATRLKKSESVIYLPFASLSAKMISITCLPILLIAYMP